MSKSRSSTYKKKAIVAAKALVRRQGFCEFCGKKAGEVQLHGSHIFPVEYAPTAADPENLLCICASCHKFSKHAWHKGPEIAVWFYRTQTERYERLYKKAHSGEIPDWESVYAKLTGGL